MKNKFWGAILIAFLTSTLSYAGLDVAGVVENLEKNNKQLVRTIVIDSLDIVRGPGEFRLSRGELTLFDFGSGRICAMTFIGPGEFIYSPPNDVERGQVRKFIEQDSVLGNFNQITFVFTVDLELPDVSQAQYIPVSKEAWNQLKETREDEFDHLNINFAGQIMGDLLSDGPGSYFNAHFKLNQRRDFVFIEDPFSDDLFALIELLRHGAESTNDYISGFSPGNDLPSQRGVVPIDITHYDINSQIELGGKMLVDCKVVYNPLRWGRQYIYFPWYYKNKIISVTNFAGDTLQVIHHVDKAGILTSRADEAGFGVVLNKPMALGAPDSVRIRYQCDALENIWGVFYISTSGQAFWYPQNIISDRATFNLRFDCHKDLEIVATGNLVEHREENGRIITRWVEDYPVCFTSFNVGNFDKKMVALDSIPPVKAYLSQNIPHDEIALYWGSMGILSNADMLGRVSGDVSRSLKFYSGLFGPCPFDTIKVTEIPQARGMGSPGLVHLAWSTFQTQGFEGEDEQFRAHEVAHQWWPHTVTTESYRDNWLMEGLAEYCGFLYFQKKETDNKTCNKILGYWLKAIYSGMGKNSVGGEAGPIIIGARLNSSKSDDYSTLVYEKGAYVYHMIRYLMHDYKTGSDDAFIAFLRDVIAKYRNKPLTTERFRALLEEHVDGDMGWFFNQWVYGTETPEYKFKYDVSPTSDGKYKVSGHITQQDVPADFQMVVPLTVLFEGDKYVHFKVVVDQPEVDIDLPLLPYEPKEIKFNTYNAVLCKVKYD